jgi:DnaK suppressor protein
MTTVNTKEFKSKLTAERDALVAKLDAQEHNLAVDTNETPDPVDMAAQAYSKNVLLALSASENRQLGMIEEALERITKRSFGKCMNCKNPINPKRLQAVPWARYCIECQQLQEQGLLDDEDG